jgi:type VI protein secretion system component VasF
MDSEVLCMLNEAERNVLLEIERAISAEDPSLAALLESAWLGRSSRRERLARDVIIIFAALLALVCVMFAQPGAGLVAALFAGLAALLRCRRFPPSLRRRPRPRGID